jgi:dihydroflavonol-4-reductase
MSEPVNPVYPKQKIMITGGCGFLGQWLTRDLLDRFEHIEIKILDLKENERSLHSFHHEPRVEVVLDRDIRSLRSIETEFAGVDTVIHLAGMVSFSAIDRVNLYQIHVKGTKNTLEAAIRNHVKLFIHISSTAALGYNDDRDKPIDETYQFDWSTIRKKKKYYMLTKRLADLKVHRAMSRGLKCIIVHPALMFGPGDHHDSTKWIQAVRDGKMPINTPGGNNVIDVRDVSRGLVCTLEKGRAGRQYLLCGYNMTFRQINEVMAQTTNGKPPRLTLPRALYLPTYYLSHMLETISRGRLGITTDRVDSAFKFRYFVNKRALEELSWQPQIPFEKTIQDTIKWLDQHE